MELDAIERGLLEKSIDGKIEEIPGLISTMRISKVKETLQFKDDSDFVFGLVLGGIMEKFFYYYYTTHDIQSIPTQIRIEIMNIILCRVKEIKEAIFKCG